MVASPDRSGSPRKTGPRTGCLDDLPRLAASDPSPVVRLALASALQRIPLDRRWPILEALLAHSEDADDHNLPLMDWYAVEPLAAAEPARALKLAQGAKIPKILPFTVRRVAAIGTPEALRRAGRRPRQGRRPGRPPDDARRDQRGAEGHGDRSRSRPAWPDVFAGLLKDADPEVRSQATALALTFGDASALAVFRAVRGRPEGRNRPPPRGPRRPAQGQGCRAGADPPGAPRANLRCGARPSAPSPRSTTRRRPRSILKVYPTLAPTDRRDALNTLAARVGYAKALLAAVGEKRVPPADLSADLIRQLRNHKDAEVDAAIGRVWGSARETPSDRIKVIAETKAKLLTQARPEPRRQPRPLGLRQDLPAVPRPVRHRRQRRPRADRLEPRRPRLPPDQRLRPLGPDRQGLPGPRRRHQGRPGPDRDHPIRG